MACSNSLRVDILGIFLFSTILFSFVSNTSYESFAISNDIEIETNSVIHVKKTAVNHSISFSESMGFSTPEEKKDLDSISIDDQKNVKRITFVEGLNFSSDVSQHESSIILVKQISDRKGMLERIITNDRIRYQDKLSNKNYFDNNLESIYSDSNLQSNVQENPINFPTNLLLNENLISNNFGITSTETSIYNLAIEPIIDSFLQLKSTSNIFDPNDYSGIIILVLISSIILIRSENNNIKFYNFRKFFSYVFMIILLSSTILTPASISSSYWGTAFGEEIHNTNSSSNLEINSLENVIDDLPLEFFTPNSTIPEDSNNFSYPEINFNNTSNSFLVEEIVENSFNNYITENNTEPIIENYTVPISNYTEPTIENYTVPISNYTEPTIENYTVPISNYTEPIIIPNATESWEFDSQVNGSQFVGDVYIEEDIGLVLEGDGYVTNDGNSTSNISNLTITAWVKPYYANGSAELTVVSKENTFDLIINNVVDPQRVATFSVFDGIQRHTVVSSTTFGENWSHIAVTFNGTLLSVYTNGTLSNEKRVTDTITLTSDGQLELKTPELVTSSSDVVVGATLDNTRSIDEVSKKFSGEIYDVNIYDVYLSGEQIAEIYNTSFPIVFDATNSTKDIPIEEIETIDVLEDITSIEIDNVIGIDNLFNYTEQDIGIELNGTESFVTIEKEELNEELNQLTISTFIKPNYTNASAEFVVLSKENSFVLSLNNIISPEHVPKFSVFDGITWTDANGFSKIENWSHLVGIINQTNISLYVNGTLEGTSQLSEPIFVSADKLQLTTADVLATDSDLVIGAYISTVRDESKLSNYFSGSIDEVLIYKETLNESQIQKIYSEFIDKLQVQSEFLLPLPIESQNITSTLSHDEIIIGQSVNWIQTIELKEDVQNIQVEIPADAKNIQVEIIESYELIEISNEQVGVLDSFSPIESDELKMISLEKTTMEKIDQVFQEEMDTKLVIITANASQYLLEFETPAPYITEEDNSNNDMFNKTVTVAHDSTLHYTDVRSYSDLPENLVHDGIEFSLFWNINGTKTNVTNDPKFQVEFVDTNNNGILDRIFWVVPQLSEQVFEIVGISSSQTTCPVCKKPTIFTVRYDNPTHPDDEVRIEVYKKEGDFGESNKILAEFDGVMDGDEITIDSRIFINDDKDTVHSNTAYRVLVDGQEMAGIKIHTSCSQDLFVGDVHTGDFGVSFTVVSGTDADLNPTIPDASCKDSASGECQDVFLDFEGIPHGAPLSYINNLPQLKNNGITLVAPENHSGPFETFIIFDSDETGTSDPDLEVNEGNLVIVPENDIDDNPEDGIFDDPDDHPAGGKQVYEFEHPRVVKSFVFVDHERNQATAKAFDVNGNLIKSVVIPLDEDGSVQTITMNAANTSRLEIKYNDSGGVTQIDLSCSAQGFVKLHGLLRDFKDSHPDFQHIIGDDDGIVKPNLGDGNGAESDNLAHAKIGATVTTTSAENFNQWYKNFENINQCKELNITLTPNNDGLFEFSDTTFFPIDGELFGNQGRSHNYHFTYEMRGTFEFGSGQTIQVNGDDDIWIFVNHKLIYDGGGVLPPRDSGLLELDLLNISKSLDLEVGQVYDIDIFFAERHTVLSVLEIETNINIFQKNLSCIENNFEIELDEELEFNDSGFDIASAFNIGIEESLESEDNEIGLIKGKIFKQEFNEKLQLQDTSLTTRINGMIHINLSEQLQFQDTVQADNMLHINLSEKLQKLQLQDTSLTTRINGMIHINLSEQLQFQDTVQADNMLHINLSEKLQLQERH